jgi:hypothetical protein
MKNTQFRIANHHMNVTCNLWKRSFTLTNLVPFAMFASLVDLVHNIYHLVAYVCGFDDYNMVNASYNVPKMQKTFLSHIVHFPLYFFQAMRLLGSWVITIH